MEGRSAGCRIFVDRFLLKHLWYTPLISLMASAKSLLIAVRFLCHFSLAVFQSFLFFYFLVLLLFEFVFVLLEVHWTSQMCFVGNLGEVLTFPAFSFSCLFDHSYVMHLVVHISWRSHHFPICSPNCTILSLSSDQPILCSARSDLLLNPSSEFFISVIVLLSFRISVWFCFTILVSVVFSVWCSVFVTPSILPCPFL